MAGSFGREVKILFEDVIENFDKDLSLSMKCGQFTPDAKGMQRQGDVFWRPVPMISEITDGMTLVDGDFDDLLGLQVPGTLSHVKNVPWKLDAKELRDDFYRKQQAKSARQRLAAQIEESIATNVAMTGSQVVKRGTLTGYADLAECDAVLNEIGVPMDGRDFFFNARDNNAVAATLAGKETIQGKTERAMNRNYIGQFAGFDTYKTDVLPRLTAAAGSGITVVGYDQALTPAATSTASSGEISNVDNRYMNLTVSSTTGVVAGDCFTIADVYKVHLITKTVLPTLFTFRVIEVVSATVLKVTALIDSGPYQNVDAAPAHGASLTFLNTVAGQVNAFWHGESIEVIHGRLGLEELRGGGLDIMTATTDQGVQIALVKQGSINALQQKYRWVIFYGTSNKNPLMNGIMLSGQS